MEGLPSIDVSNVLSEEKRQQVIALGRLGWPLRRIQQETGIRRETAGAYLKAAGVAVRAPGGWGRRAPAKPANEVSPDPATDLAFPAESAKTGQRCPPTRRRSRCPAAAHGQRLRALLRLHRTLAEQGPERQGHLPGPGRQTTASRAAIQASSASSASCAGSQHSQACAVIVTPPGEEAQVDYGSGPMVRDPHSGRYRRTRLFVLTLGYSRKAVRLLTFQSSTRTWAELHEQAFRRLGGADAHGRARQPQRRRTQAGHLRSRLEPAVSRHARSLWRRRAALPRRRSGSQREGRARRRARQEHTLKGLRFESLEEAQTYLDHWEAKWADTRIHGTTKRQVAAMFAEEKPSLLPLPLEPFRVYQFGDRRVNLDGCVEVEAAYYSAPPGWIGRSVKVQWDGHVVRVLDPRTGQLLARTPAARSAAAIASRTKTSPRRRRAPPSNCWRVAARSGHTSARVAEQTYRRDGPECHPPHHGLDRLGAQARRRAHRRCLRRRVGSRVSLPIRIASSAAGWSAGPPSRFARWIPSSGN